MKSHLSMSKINFAVFKHPFIIVLREWLKKPYCSLNLERTIWYAFSTGRDGSKYCDTSNYRQAEERDPDNSADVFQHGELSSAGQRARGHSDRSQPKPIQDCD